MSTKRAAPSLSQDDVLRIDIHTHILPRTWPNLREKFGYGGFIRLEHDESTGRAKMWQDDVFFREVEPNCWDCDCRVTDIDRTDVDVQVLSTVPVMFSYWAQPQDCLFLSRLINDDLAARVKERPDRFVALGTVPMQDPELAVQELTRCMKELGMAGVEIGSRVNKWNLDEPALEPFWTAAEELGAAVFVHPWDMDKERMPKYWLPWLVGMPAETTLAMCSMIFSGVFERHPKLRVAFAHGGGQFPYTIGRIEKGFTCRPDLVAVDNDTNPRKYIGQFWVDSLTHDAEALKYMVNLMGANRVALGSDYPFPLGEQEPGKTILAAGFDDETAKSLLHGSALEFLGIAPADAEQRFHSHATAEAAAAKKKAMAAEAAPEAAAETTTS